MTHHQALRLDILSTDASSGGSGGGSQEEGAAVSSGELTNLLAVDAQSVLELMVFSKWEGYVCVRVYMCVCVHVCGVYMHNTRHNANTPLL